MATSEDAVSSLEKELFRLVERCKPWPQARWSTHAHGVEGTRGDVAYSLVCELAAVCPSTPEGVRPPRLRDLALADQLAVVGAELVAWLRSAPDAALGASAEDLVRKTRDALEPSPLH